MDDVAVSEVQVSEVPVSEVPVSEVLVSVVMAVRNAAPHLDSGARGLRSLTYPNLDIIVVDDGSTDATAAWCAQLARSDTRVRVIACPRPVGVATARQRGLAAARGDYVWFCDIDDRWSPTIVDVLVGRARSTGADIVCARARRIELGGRCWTMEGFSDDRTLVRSQIADAILRGHLRGYLWNKLFRRHVLPIDPDEPLTSQSDFLVVLAACTRATAVHLMPDVLYDYLEHPQSISASRDVTLANVQYCHDRALSQLTPDGGGAQAAFFTTWFLIVPAVTTPVHHRWPKEQAHRIRRDMGARLRWSMVWATLRADRSVGLHAAMIKATGPAYAPLYRAVGRALGFSVR